jgi:hypothetical protein
MAVIPASGTPHVVATAACVAVIKVIYFIATRTGEIRLKIAITAERLMFCGRIQPCTIESLLTQYARQLLGIHVSMCCPSCTVTERLDRSSVFISGLIDTRSGQCFMVWNGYAMLDDGEMRKDKRT